MIFWLYKKHIAARTIIFTLKIKLNQLALVGGVPLLTIQLLAESGFASNATSYIYIYIYVYITIFLYIHTNIYWPLY